MTIGERLFKLRKEKNISQEELANELGVSRQTVSKWETGESTPDFDKIIPLCDFYGISSDELLSGKKNIIVARNDNINIKFGRNIAIAVGLYIFSLVVLIFFSTALKAEIVGVCLFFTIIAVATGLLIYNGIVNKTDKEIETIEEKKKNKIVKQVCEIVDLISLVLYFIISFATGAWHITWVIFIINGICEIIVKLIFDLKDNQEEKKDE